MMHLGERASAMALCVFLYVTKRHCIYLNRTPRQCACAGAVPAPASVLDRHARNDTDTTTLSKLCYDGGCGLRVREVEVDLRHRATGTDLGAQLHRARQLRDVSRALAARGLVSAGWQELTGSEGVSGLLKRIRR